MEKIDLNELNITATDIAAGIMKNLMYVELEEGKKVAVNLGLLCRFTFIAKESVPGVLHWIIDSVEK